MQLGTPISLFPTFAEFCEQARTFPHVLPHKFTAALEGYYQIFGDQAFILTTRYRNPDIPFFEQAYQIGETTKKTAYIYFEKAVPLYHPDYHPICPHIYEGQLCAYIDNYRARINYDDIQMTISYLEAAADRLLAFKTATPLATPTRRPLQDVKPYTTLSVKAAEYISRSSTIQVGPIPAIVNAIKADNVVTPAVPYPRLANLDATVRYMLEPLTPTIEV